MSATYYVGYNVKVSLAGVNYSVSRCVVRDSVEPQDVSNTEGNAGNPLVATQSPSFKSQAPAQSSATIELTQPTFDASNNPFTAPISLAPGSYASCVIYLNGRAGKNWNFANVLITEGELDGDVKALQPVTLRAISDGAYTRPA